MNMTSCRDDAVGRLRYTADNELFTVVLSEPGCGKSTLILVGQTELWDQKLRLQKYAAIRQRIDMNIVLERLDRAETAKYMAAHLANSGSEKELFTTDAEEEIFKVSSGIPRMLNRICEKSLMYAFQQKKRLIDGHMVRYVAEHEMLKGAE